MNTQPIISVVMPVFNGRKYLTEAIESVLQQSFTDFEFIIVNDGSTDDSESIILSYQDPRIRYIKQTNTGVGGALKTGCKLALGKYIARMDADDICIATRFYHQRKFLDENPRFVLVGSAVYHVSDAGVELSRSFPYKSNFILKKLINMNSPFTHPSIMMCKNAYDKVGGYEDLEPLEDIYLWIKLANVGKFENLSMPLLKSRIVLNSVSRSISITQSNRLRDFMLKIQNEETLSKENMLNFKAMYQQIKEMNAMKKKDNKIVSYAAVNHVVPLENWIYHFFKKLRFSEKLIEYIICNLKIVYALYKF